MTTIEDIMYQETKKRIAAMNAGIMTPGWEWEKILSEWNRRGPMYNGMIWAKPEEPVHIDTKNVYEVENE